MPDDRRWTVIVVPQGHGHTTRTFEVSHRRLRWAVWGGGAALLLVLAMAGTWLYLASQAARVPTLRGQVRELRREVRGMDSLAAQLTRIEEENAKVRSMLGADRRDSAAVPRPAAAGEDSAADAEGEPATRGSSRPSQWPLLARGFVTRGHLAPIRGRHPGIDIAVASGSRIVASGGGTVAEVGEDSVYGRFVRIAHPDGFETLYAHASRLMVRPNQRVAALQVIGLSGSTGVSTAPHLHFEVRKDGRPVDPGTWIPIPR
ncbi:MAG TPA: M23 family metallopeptidase [Longimicrobium sp.]|nr:M23 family metallopeptidase [Longimicrobium sp.]